MKHLCTLLVPFILTFSMVHQLIASDFFSSDFKDNIWPDKPTKSQYHLIIDSEAEGKWKPRNNYITKEFVKALDIPIHKEVPTLDGIEISAFKNFKGFKDFTLDSNIILQKERVSFIIQNTSKERYSIVLSQFKTCQEAWTNFALGAEFIELHDNAIHLFQKTLFNDIYAIKSFCPIGVCYVYPYGAYLVRINSLKPPTFEAKKSTTPLKPEKRIFVIGGEKEFKEHEKNLEYIIKELNLILSKKKKISPNKNNVI